MGALQERFGSCRRTTKETTIALSIVLDGGGESSITTGIPFFDHTLEQIAKHGGLVLEVAATGDLEVDTHHVVEDVGICFGTALHEALGDRSGVRRFSDVAVPMDETLISVALDLSGRPYLYYDVSPPSPYPLGSPGYDPQLTEEFFRALVISSGITLHISMVRGRNTHHIVEAVSKAFGRALREAKEVIGEDIPSTKGSLS
jgi:imidazoleglycerol-phosphate dehydratase